MNIWSTIYKGAWVVLLIVVAATIMRLFTPKWNEFRAVQETKSRLEEEIRLTEELISNYRQKQERFQNDPLFVERMAHEAGLAKDNETIFRFED